MPFKALYSKSLLFISLGIFSFTLKNSFFIPKPKLSEKVILPIEVLGEEGKVVERSFFLTKDIASNSQELWFQVNNLSYQGKGSIKINDGNWLNLIHDNVEMFPQEAARGGMVHGGFSTIRFTIPATDIQAGENTIYFRFNKSDGISIGYRIVSFNLLNEAGLKLLPEDFFEEDDPENWEPFNTDANYIQEGEALWRQEGKLWNHYLPDGRTGNWYATVIPAARPIQASCADCHTQDGRDLELFAYSNESIVERAKFHQLTEEEGKKIASYIRTLSTTKANVNRYGRPWNPPFQPGPQLAGKGIEYWPAGAGLDAVLDSDAEMLPYLFSNGINEAEVSSRFDNNKTLDRTELPLAIQFPDWKHWLPMIHPKDAFTQGDYYNTYTPTTAFTIEDAYAGIREFLEATDDPTAYDRTELYRWMGRYQLAVRGFIPAGASPPGDHWRTKLANSPTLQSLFDTRMVDFSATSLARMLAVKNFEFQHEFDLMDKAPYYTNPEDNAFDRQWVSQNFGVFEIPPHFTGCAEDDDCQSFTGQPRATGQFESTAWYHYQLIINGGEGQVGNNNGVVDRNYQEDYILKSSFSSGIHQPLRYYHSVNSNYQARTYSLAGTHNEGTGFKIRQQGPWYFLGKEADAGSSQFSGFAPGFWPRLLDKTETGLTKWIVEAQMRQFLQEVRHNPKNSLDTWIRSDVGGDETNNLDPVNKITIGDVTGNLGGLPSPYYADHMYWSIEEAIKLGIDCQIIDSLIDWSIEAWPNITDYQASNGSTRTTTETHLFEELRQVSEAGVNIRYVDGQACSPSLEAIIYNGGNQPTINWMLNGQSLGANAILSLDQIPETGGLITCQINSNSSCIAPSANVATATYFIPPQAEMEVNISVNDDILNNEEERVTDLGENLRADINVYLPNISSYFSPIQWLDATQLSLSSGSVVSQWDDISGQGNPATTSLANNANNPVFDAEGMNGKPSVVFGNSIGTELQLFSDTQDDFLTNDWMMIVVGEASLDATGRHIIAGNKNGGGGNGFFVEYQDRLARMSVASDRASSNRSYPSSNQHITVIIKEREQLKILVNGVEEVSFSSNEVFTNTAAFTLGGVNGSANYYKGSIAEVMIFDRVLVDSERMYLENYLATKWEIDNEVTYSLAEQGILDYPSLFNLKMLTPLGEELNLIINKIQASYTIPLVSNNFFGEYQLFNNQECNNTAFYSFNLINSAASESTFGSSVSASNTLTPNGDGQNDTWQVDGLEDFLDYKISVFNNTGKVLFDTSDYQQDWGGTYNGQTLPEGIYYYIIVGVNLQNSKQTKTGYITLIR